MTAITWEQKKGIILKFWEEEVGEIPENGESTLPGFVKLYGLVPVERAIEKWAADNTLEASEDVMESVERQLREWARRGWCTPENPQNPQKRRFPKKRHA